MFVLLLVPLVASVEELSFSSTTLEDFEVEFEIDVTDLDKQYFLFESTDNWTFVTFERKERQYELSLVNGEAHEIYTAPVIDDQLTFSWPDLRINGVQMTLVLKQGDLQLLNLNFYRFISSIVGFTILGTSKLEAVYSCEKACRYYYLVIPFVLCVLGSRSDLFYKLYNKRYISPTETEEFRETNV